MGYINWDSEWCFEVRAVKLEVDVMAGLSQGGAVTTLAQHISACLYIIVAHGFKLLLDAHQQVHLVSRQHQPIGGGVSARAKESY